MRKTSTFAPAAIGLLIGSGVVSSASAAILTLTDKDNGRRVAAQVGDEIRVELRENASTGYRWTLARHDARVLKALEPSAKYPGGGVVGASGTAIFRFTAKRAGSGGFALKYWRAWLGEHGVVDRFSATIDVRR